jgi:ketosteroid isomerase-like protein
MTNINLTFEYFTKFSNKDISALNDMFTDDITLTDWDINVSGKTNVLDANKNIFDNVKSISIIVKNIAENNNFVFAEIDITINSETLLNVVDVIEFRKEKIKSICAYKR